MLVGEDKNNFYSKYLFSSKMNEDKNQIFNWLGWLVTFKSPADILTNHWSLFVCEILFYVTCVLTIIHAARLGGRYLYLWLATFIHGLVVESLSYIIPDIDNFWHAQSSIMLLGNRLPLHIICLYPVFLYTGSVSVSRLRLPSWSEPFAVGLAVVLIDVPFDIIGIKQLWWTWHDTDPNIFDRSYWVPWVSYYFHASFAAALVIWIKLFRRMLTGTTTLEAYSESDKNKELVCSVLSGVLAMPLGILFFIPVYHVLHDVFLVSTKDCVVLYLAAFVLILWTVDRNPSIGARTGRPKLPLDEISVLIIIYYVTLLTLSYLTKPETIVSYGIHETVGPCNEIQEVRTPLGMVLKKRKYLCLGEYEEDYYDFHCIGSDKLPSDGTSWYTVCGTPHTNFVEHIVVVGGACVFALVFFYNLLFRSGSDITRNISKIKRF